MMSMEFWDERPDPTDAEIEAVARAWISYQQRHDEPRDADSNMVGEVVVGRPENRHGSTDNDDRDAECDDPEWWAVEAVEDANQDSLVEVLWRLILKLCELADPDPDGVLGMVAAGPLYDYIVFRSPDGLGRAEATAPDNPKLLAALAGVWSDERINARIDRFLAAHGQERR
jgi:hypothetical protein